MRTQRTKLPSWIWTVAAAAVFAIGFGGVASAYHGDDDSRSGECVARHAPELDPGTGGSGLALLIGGVLLAFERYRSH